MAMNYDFEIFAHPSIYVSAKDAAERKLRIYFSEPEAGVNEETGILLLISGFGGHANSKVYQKMRRQFADTHNLITVQCDYFGWEFMQAPDSVHFSADLLKRIFPSDEVTEIFQSENPQKTLAEKLSQLEDLVTVDESMKESLHYFNDMGIMQAIDNISAVIAVLEILKDNGYSFNTNKIIAYGHSHGAYLAYLCNAFAPSLFSMLFDNSAWLFPRYLNENRCVELQLDNIHLAVVYRYLAQRTRPDRELLDLSALYQNFNNQCFIVSFHGSQDDLIPFSRKQEFLQQMNHTHLYEVSESKVDGKIFHSHLHGLGANFLNLFDFAMKEFARFPAGKTTLIENQLLQTKQSEYFFDYSKGLPILTIR